MEKIGSHPNTLLVTPTIVPGSECPENRRCAHTHGAAAFARAVATLGVRAAPGVDHRRMGPESRPSQQNSAPRKECVLWQRSLGS